MSNPEASRFTQSINDDKNTHHSGAQRDGGVGSLRSNTNSKHGRGVHSIAVNPSATSSAERLSLAPEGIHEFFTDDEQSFLEGMGHFAVLKPAETSAPQLYSHRPFSAPSINTVVFCGVWNMSVSQLCDVIKQRRSLRRAKISSTQCYTEFNGRVVHRFLILELHREGRKGIWLRLDRRPSGSTWQLLRAIGKAPAKDTAQLAVVKQDLIGSASLENRQVFETVPTLGELQYFLSVVCDELTVYKAWPENCYFYCSLIQEHLGAEGEGIFSKGKLSYADLAQGIRGRVQERVRLFYHMPAPLTLSSLLTSLELPCDNALDLSRQWDSLKSTVSVGSYKLADKLERALRPVGETLLSTSRFVESVALSQLTRELWRSLDHKGERPTASSQYHDDFLQGTRQFNGANELGTDGVHISPYLRGCDREEYCKRLSRSLCTHGISLRGDGRFDDACNAGAEAVALSRHLYERDREQYCEHLSQFLYEYQSSLRKAQRFDDACKAGTEDVALSRHLYDRDPFKHRKDLARSLCQYGISLREAERFNEACNAGVEDVSLSRHLYGHDQSRYHEGLALSLSPHCLLLRNAKRFNEACNAGAEGVALFRHLYDRDPNQYREDLARSLRRYGISLREAERFNEACKAGAEDVSLSRHLYDRDSSQYCEDLAASLCWYGISLREAKQFNEACNAGAEDVSLSRRLYDRDQVRYHAGLALSLSHHCLSLRKAKRFNEACEAGAEGVALSRHLYSRDPNRYREDLARSLRQYGVSLLEAKRFNEMCKAGAEGVSLSRYLCDHDPGQYRKDLARSLCWYGISLREAKRFNDACQVIAEGVTLFHHLYDRNPNQYREDLARSLSHHCLSLREAKRFNEACKAGAKDVSFSRHLYARDPKYREDLARSLRQYGISLQNDGQSDNACEAVIEAVTLIGHLYERDPGQYRHKLAIALCHYDNTLRGTGRFEDARTLARRSFVLFHQLYHGEATLDPGVAEYIHEHYGIPPRQVEGG